MDDDKELPAPGEEIETGGDDEIEVPTEEEPTDDADLEEPADEEGTGEDDGSGQGTPPAGDKGRAAARISKLANDRKAERERAERAERDVAELRRQMEEVQGRLRQNSQPDPRVEQELLAQMDPVQRVQYESQKAINALQAQIQQVQRSSIDAADKASFLSNLSPKELAIRQKYLPKIEAQLADMQKKGFGAPRKEIYAYLRGMSLIEAEGKAKPKNPDRDAAQGRVAATQSNTASSRGDAAGGKKGKTAEERLGDMLI